MGKKTTTTRIMIANGVNLDLLGKREPEIYGNFSLANLEKTLHQECAKLAKLFSLTEIELQFFQSNHEAEFLDMIGKFGGDGIVINAGAWTHTSVALRDRLAAVNVPFVEIHISNLAAREEFRHKSFTASIAKGVVYGFGIDSYLVGIFGLLKFLSSK